MQMGTLLVALQKIKITIRNDGQHRLCESLSKKYMTLRGSMKEAKLPCKECSQASLRGMSDPLEQVATSDGPIFLYRCKKCGALWEENLREAHTITKEDAQNRFPSNKRGIRI